MHVHDCLSLHPECAFKAKLSKQFGANQSLGVLEVDSLIEKWQRRNVLHTIWLQMGIHPGDISRAIQTRKC